MSQAEFELKSSKPDKKDCINFRSRVKQLSDQSAGSKPKNGTVGDSLFDAQNAHLGADYGSML